MTLTEMTQLMAAGLLADPDDEEVFVWRVRALGASPERWGWGRSAVDRPPPDAEIVIAGRVMDGDVDRCAPDDLRVTLYAWELLAAIEEQVRSTDRAAPMRFEVPLTGQLSLL